MEFILTLFVLAIGATYIKRLENKIKVQDEKISEIEQLYEFNLIKYGKEKTSKKTVKAKAIKAKKG